MKIIKYIILINFLYTSQNLKADNHLSDENYYKKGVQLYENGNFSESFIVFFNLAIKNDSSAQFNLSNMYSNGVGTPQDFKEALKWSWFCALGGEKKCLKNIDEIRSKIDEKTLEKISLEVEKTLVDELYKNNNIQFALKLGFWFERFSPNIDLEQAYIWYSVSVTGGLYKAMKVRDKVGKKIDSEKIVELQTKANEIYTKVKYFVN